jgi:hypothetical protein
MKEDLGELIEYLDGKFTGTNQTLVTLKADIDTLREEKADKKDINNILNAIDSYAKKAETFFEEMVALAHKVDRHEKWILQIANKLGVKLEY